MKFFNRKSDPAQLQPNVPSPSLCLQLMTSGNENEVEKVRRELLKGGIASEKRRHPELQQVSSLLQKGIEEILVRESELASECASLHNKVEELTRTLDQAHADAARAIKNREAAEHNQAEQLTGLLATLERERREWQQKLKSSDDSYKHAKGQAGALSRLLQTQQAVTTALKKELAALELQRDQQERALSEASKEVAAEREARVAAEQRAGLAEESLQTQWVERQELERQVQAHAASLGSLLTRVTSTAVGITGEP
jgi:chromosome segregation ATPase